MLLLNNTRRFKGNQNTYVALCENEFDTPGLQQTQSPLKSW